MKLTEDQIRNLLAFLNRTQLQGSEAETLVQLKIALVTLAKELEKPVEPVKEETKK